MEWFSGNAAGQSGTTGGAGLERSQLRDGFDGFCGQGHAVAVFADRGAVANGRHVALRGDVRVGSGAEALGAELCQQRSSRHCEGLHSNSMFVAHDRSALCVSLICAEPLGLRWSSHTTITTRVFMKFESLEEVSRFCTHIEREKDMLLCLAQVHELLIAALVSSHPDHGQFQLMTTSLLERSMNTTFKDLPEDQKQLIRNRVEHMQLIPKTNLPNPVAHLSGTGHKQAE